MKKVIICFLILSTSVFAARIVLEVTPTERDAVIAARKLVREQEKPVVVDDVRQKIATLRRVKTSLTNQLAKVDAELKKLRAE